MHACAHTVRSVDYTAAGGFSETCWAPPPLNITLVRAVAADRVCVTALLWDLCTWRFGLLVLLAPLLGRCHKGAILFSIKGIHWLRINGLL